VGSDGCACVEVSTFGSLDGLVGYTGTCGGIKSTTLVCGGCFDDTCIDSVSEFRTGLEILSGRLTFYIAELPNRLLHHSQEKLNSKKARHFQLFRITKSGR
jgi:hypothetical protein